MRDCVSCLRPPSLPCSAGRRAWCVFGAFAAALACSHGHPPGCEWQGAEDSERFCRSCRLCYTPLKHNAKNSFGPAGRRGRTATRTDANLSRDKPNRRKRHQKNGFRDSTGHRTAVDASGPTSACRQIRSRPSAPKSTRLAQHAGRTAHTGNVWPQRSSRRSSLWLVPYARAGKSDPAGAARLPGRIGPDGNGLNHRVLGQKLTPSECDHTPGSANGGCWWSATYRLRSCPARAAP